MTGIHRVCEHVVTKAEYGLPTAAIKVINHYGDEVLEVFEV